MKVRVVTQEKYMQVSFEYNLQTDTPEGVVDEMKNDLNLKDAGQIMSLKKQI